jgi:hypothetical protein
MGNALAPQTKPSTELVDQGKPVHRTGGRLQNHLVKLRWPSRSRSSAAVLAQRHHSLDSLPDWQCYDICAHLKWTKCGSVGWVDPRPNWPEVINFNKGIGRGIMKFADGLNLAIERGWLELHERGT